MYASRFGYQAASSKVTKTLANDSSTCRLLIANTMTGQVCLNLKPLLRCIFVDVKPDDSVVCCHFQVKFRMIRLVHHKCTKLAAFDRQTFGFDGIHVALLSTQPLAEGRVRTFLHTITTRSSYEGRSVLPDVVVDSGQIAHDGGHHLQHCCPVCLTADTACNINP